MDERERESWFQKNMSCEVHEFIDIKMNKWARHYKRKCKPMNSKKKKKSLKICF